MSNEERQNDIRAAIFLEEGDRKTKVRADAIAEKQRKMMPAKTGRYGELRLGGLAPQKRRNVQIVAGHFPRDFVDVFLDL